MGSAYKLKSKISSNFIPYRPSFFLYIDIPIIIATTIKIAYQCTPKFPIRNAVLDKLRLISSPGKPTSDILHTPYKSIYVF